VQAFVLVKQVTHGHSVYIYIYIHIYIYIMYIYMYVYIYIYSEAMRERAAKVLVKLVKDGHSASVKQVKDAH
jgi:hypothetical protein